MKRPFDFSFCCEIKLPFNNHKTQIAKSQTVASIPVRSLVAPVQSLDCLAGLESVEPTCRQVECTVQDQGQEGTEGGLEETSEREGDEEEQKAADLVSHPD